MNMKDRHLLDTFIPMTTVLAHLAGVPAALVFFSAALAIFSMAALIARSTERVAQHVGAAKSSVLNATRGTASERLISIITMKSGHYELVRSSLIGAILGDPLRAPGLSYFLGAARYHGQN